MSKRLEVITERSRAEQVVAGITSLETTNLVLFELEGGIINFADVAFRGLASDRLLARKVTREAEGRGPHFDAYGDLLHPDYPYVGLYNLSGTADVTTAPLQKELVDAYNREFPTHTDEAYEARRKFGFVAIATAGEDKTTGILAPRTGFVLTQNPGVLPVVHNVVPQDKENSGEFIKFAVPNSNTGADEYLRDDGYMPFDELLTQALGGVIVEPGKVVTKIERVPVPVPSRTMPRSRFGQGRVD